MFAKLQSFVGDNRLKLGHFGVSDDQVFSRGNPREVANVPGN